MKRRDRTWTTSRWPTLNCGMARGHTRTLILRGGGASALISICLKSLSTCGPLLPPHLYLGLIPSARHSPIIGRLFHFSANYFPGQSWRYNSASVFCRQPPQKKLKKNVKKKKSLKKLSYGQPWGAPRGWGKDFFLGWGGGGRRGEPGRQSRPQTGQQCRGWWHLRCSREAPGSLRGRAPETGCCCKWFPASRCPACAGAAARSLHPSPPSLVKNKEEKESIIV
jgi:hypothetical protein